MRQHFTDEDLNNWYELSKVDKLNLVGSEIRQLIGDIRTARTELTQARNHNATLRKALKPFAELADICDHFDHKDDRRMCRITIAGVPHSGPTAGDCRKAREALVEFTALPASPGKGGGA